MEKDLIKLPLDKFGFEVGFKVVETPDEEQLSIMWEADQKYIDQFGEDAILEEVQRLVNKILREAINEEIIKQRESR